MKITTDEQYDAYETALEKTLNSVDGQYHNWIDSEGKAMFQLGNATNQQILNDAECFKIETEGREIDDICIDLFVILDAHLNYLLDI
jgi:hypothetical protein